MLFNIHIQDYIEEYYNRKGKIDWTVAAAGHPASPALILT